MALDPSPPTYFITAPTGTRTDVAATNAQFLCLDILQGTPPSDITITSTKNPWVRKGRKVDPAKIPYVEGQSIGTTFPMHTRSSVPGC